MSILSLPGTSGVVTSTTVQSRVIYYIFFFWTSISFGDGQGRPGGFDQRC